MKLTDEQIKNAWNACGLGRDYDMPPSEDEYIFARAIEAAVLAQGEPVGINGLTEAETAATASVMGIVAPEAKQEPIAYYDFQERGFYWASNTSFAKPPVSVKVEPLPLFAHPAQVNTAQGKLSMEEYVGAELFAWQEATGFDTPEEYIAAIAAATTPDSATRSADSAESFCDEEMEPHDQNWRHGEEA